MEKQIKKYQILYMRDKGMSVKEISHEVNMEYDKIYYLCRSHNIPPKRVDCPLATGELEKDYVDFMDISVDGGMIFD